MSDNQLREELETVAREILTLPSDTEWGGQGYANEQYDRFTFSDEDETDARRANETANARRAELNARRMALETEINRRVQEARSEQHDAALGAAGIPHEESANESRTDDAFEDNGPFNGINVPDENY